MTVGVPVVVSRRGALPEVGGDAVVYVDPDDARGMATVIADLLADTAAARDLARPRRRTRTPVLLDDVRDASLACVRRCGRPPEGALMRIGVDARELGGQADRRRTLPARVAAAMADDLPLAPAPIWCCSPRTRDRDTWTPPRQGGARLEWCYVTGGSGTLWEQRDLARAARASQLDVLFCPPTRPRCWLNVPTVVAMHDVSFCRPPGVVRLASRRRGCGCWRAGRARRAHTVLTLTEFSAAEIAPAPGRAAATDSRDPPGGRLPGCTVAPCDASARQSRSCCSSAPSSSADICRC